MTTYNGHRSWNAWNVSLWLYNDEATYHHAVNLAKKHGKQKATRILVREFAGEKTPDGASYNAKCIAEAMRDILM